MSSDFCIKCDNALAIYCGKCVDAEREELNRLRRLVPTGNYTLTVAHEEEIQRLKDAGEVLIRSLERMTKERDEARAELAFIQAEYTEANESNLTRDALCLRAATLRLLADKAAAEQGLAQRRMMEAQAARDKARAKAADYERDWHAAKSEFGSAMAKMREALRAAEKRELEALAKLDEERANVETLKTHVETLREAWRSASDDVKQNALCLRAATLGEAMTQWYSIDPEHNVEIWATEAEAKAAAESALEHYRDNASDGWHEQMEALEWGMLVTHGHAKEVDRVEREDDDTGLCERLGVDYRCDYVLEDCARKTNNETKKENDNGT